MTPDDLLKALKQVSFSSLPVDDISKLLTCAHSYSHPYTAPCGPGPKICLYPERPSDQPRGVLASGILATTAATRCRVLDPQQALLTKDAAENHQQDQEQHLVSVWLLRSDGICRVRHNTSYPHAATAVPARRYYRANYLIVLELACFVALIRQPLALLAVVFSTIACLLQNDSFAKSVR